MDEKQRHERGMAQRRKVLGNEWVDRANAKKTPFTEEFQDFITRAAWGDRPGAAATFDHRARLFLAWATFSASGTGNCVSEFILYLLGLIGEAEVAVGLRVTAFSVRARCRVGAAGAGKSGARSHSRGSRATAPIWVGQRGGAAGTDAGVAAGPPRRGCGGDRTSGRSPSWRTGPRLLDTR